MRTPDTDVKMDRMLDNIHLILPLLHRALLKPDELTHNPTSPEFKVMLVLILRNAQPISTIGGRLGISKPHMTAVIDKLIAHEYVERNPNTEDRRIVNVSITAKGRQYMETCKAEAREAVKKQLSTLPAEDLETLCASIETIRRILMKVSDINAHHVQTAIEKARPWSPKI